MKKMLPVAVMALFAPALTVFAADAKSNWDDNCAKCHGAEGKGDTKMGKKLAIQDFTDAKVQAKFTDDEAFKAIKDGLKDSDGKTRMKAIEGLSDDEIKALVQYVRSLKG
ncbi:MAG TPA: cytochrome c [Opitutaceae bacterium]|nr:cytochrome c [Opitutaceae bacterium]